MENGEHNEEPGEIYIYNQTLEEHDLVTQLFRERLSEDVQFVLWVGLKSGNWEKLQAIRSEVNSEVERQLEERNPRTTDPEKIRA